MRIRISISEGNPLLHDDLNSLSSSAARSDRLRFLAEYALTLISGGNSPPSAAHQVRCQSKQSGEPEADTRKAFDELGQGDLPSLVDDMLG